jgi:hypothetical protein
LADRSNPNAIRVVAGAALPHHKGRVYRCPLNEAVWQPPAPRATPKRLFFRAFKVPGTIEGICPPSLTVVRETSDHKVTGQALQRACEKSSVTENEDCIIGVGMSGHRFFWRAVPWSKQKF